MTESPQNLVGKIVAERWQITDFLGDGCMSYVYKAQDIETGKIIVLKLIKKSLLQGVDLKALDKQARNFIALNHENIASYYNVYLSSEGQLFLFCDHLQGQSLAACLTKAGKLSLDQAVHIFQQVSIGLSHAHEQKNWHGDLRPSNIFIVNDQFSVDEAKIVDFAFMNLIERLSEKKSLSTTSTHPAFANTAYISPEQKAGHNIDQFCDQYALGCMMYETLCGKPPFIGSSVMTTNYKQKQQTITALHEILPDNPFLSRYQTIVNKLLKSNHHERYQSLSDLKVDLDLILKASDSDWQRKAYAFKQSIYSKLSAKRWHILITLLILSLLTTAIFQLILIVGPYYQPWSGVGNFDDSKLWLVQERQIPKPPINIVKQKYLLAEKLTSLKKSKQESSADYIQTLFNYSRVLLACGHWQEAQNLLAELQKKELKNTEIRPPDIIAHLALSYFMLSNLSAAEDYSKRVLASVGTDPSWAGDKIIVLKILGDIYSGRVQNKEALATYEELHKLAWQVHLREPAEYAYACALLADSYRKNKQYAQAEKLYKEAIDWGINFVGQKQLFMAKAYYGLALTQYQLGELTQAENQLQQALPIAIAHQGHKTNFVITLKRFNDYLLFHQNLFAWVKQR